MTQRPYVIIDYTNWRGERGLRTILPGKLDCTASHKYHKNQWYVTAWDIEKQMYRDFAISSIHSWREVDELPSEAHDSSSADSAEAGEP